MDGVTVRHVKPEDASRLAQFYYRAYGDRARYKYPERWDWHFRDNPWRDNDRLPVYVAEAPDGEIVGHTAGVRVPCKIFDHQIKLGWSVDTIVLPESRGTGAGKKLQKINQDDHEAFASLSMNATNRHIKLKLGAILGPSAMLYVKHMKFYANKHVFLPVDASAYLLVRLLQSLSFPKKSQTHQWKTGNIEQAIFNTADSALWQEVRHHYDFAVERSADYLNWRYRDQPWTKHYCCRVYDRTDHLAGIAVYRIADELDGKAAIITELIGRLDVDDSPFHNLLSAVEKDVLRHGVTQIQVATSEKRIKEVIEKNRFLRIDIKPLVINGHMEMIGKLNPQSTAMLTKGDQDWDQYPLAIYYSPLDIIKRIRTNFSTQ